MSASSRFGAGTALICWFALLSGCSTESRPDRSPLLRRSDEGGLVTVGEDNSPARLATLADAAYGAAEYDSARVLYERATEAARAVGDSTALALALTALGRTSRQLGDYARSRRYGTEALELKQRLGLRDHLFDSYNSLGLLAWEEDRLEDASDFFHRALEVTGSLGDTARAKASANLALVLQDLGRFPEARRLFEEAAGLAQRARNPRIEGNALNNLAVLELEVGRPEVAQSYLIRAGPLIARAADRRGEFNWLGQMGAVAAALGEPGRGIAWLDSALRRSRAAELPQEEASNLEQLADLHLLAGDHRRALDLLAQAESLNVRLGRSSYLGTDLRREAEIDARLGDPVSAARKAREAARVHREAGARFEELADLLLLGEMAGETGDLGEARRHLTAARQIARWLDAPTARIATALAAARVAERSGRPRETLRVLEAEAAALALAGPEMVWQADLLRARAYVGIGDLAAGAAAGGRAIKAVERVRGGFASGLLRSSYQARQDQVYAHQVEVLLRLGRTEAAFEVADRGRGRSLLERLATMAPGGSGEEEPAASVRELAEEERKLLARIDSVANALPVLPSDAVAAPEIRAELAARRARLGRELERSRSAYEMALVRAEERSGARGALLQGESAPVIRGALAPDEALLEYLVTPTRTILFVARRDTVLSRFVQLTREDIRTRVRVARELVSRPVSPASVGTGVAPLPVLIDLWAALIGPAREAGGLAGIRRLVIVPHAELQYLPFAALQDSATRRFLIQDFILLYLPSAAAFPVLRARAGVPQPRSGVAFAPFPDQLPATGLEVSAFENNMARSRVRRGSRATEAEVRRALSRDPIVHLATHGFLSVANPMFSRIELIPGKAGRSEDDGRLEVHEVLQLPARSSLVFLSGCETGAGGAWQTAFDVGEDYATLARAFLYAGVLDVVATLWRVEDESAAVFAARFYEALATRRPAEALAEAQRAMLSQEHYRAPFYWAAYRLDGGG